MTMEIKIGIADSNRELTLQTKQTDDEVKAAVTDAMTGAAALLELTDEKGKRYLVPAARVAYVELGSAEVRAVGFSAI
jgi:hypothetical protein